MNSPINYFMIMEEQLIVLEIQKDFISLGEEMKPTNQDDINRINSNLLLTDDTNLTYRVHHLFINSIITSYIKAKFNNNIEELKSIFQFEQIKCNENIVNMHIEIIPELIEQLHIAFLNSEFILEKGKLIRKKSKHHLRENGAVYTLKTITNQITSKTIEYAIEEKKIATEITCLDFACGTGRFYFEAIKILHEKYYIEHQDIICKNLFAIDIDGVALSILRCKVISLFKKLNTEIINAISKNIIKRNALIPKAMLIQESKDSIDLTNDFKSVIINGGFDVVFSNPPYNLLKVNKKEDEQQLIEYYGNLQNKVLNEINFFRTSGIYQFSIEGMLNYYQLSIEMIIRLTKPKGQIGIICPSSLFADLTSSKLRKHLLNSHKLYFIRYYPEAARLFENVTQSTVIFYLQKNEKTNKIGIEISENTFEINFLTIKNIFPSNFEIPLIDSIGWSILKKISNQKKIKNLPFIRNRRGELDLSLFKSVITIKNTGWRLIRGNMISDNAVIDKNGEYVIIESFLSKKSEDFKINDYNKERLICQQISNIDIERRLKFVFCQKTDIIANSCNYIVSTRSQSDLKKLYYILNSDLLNWRFKITSSNNHINNYELDDLPIIDLDNVNLNDFSFEEHKNNEVICKLYGLTETETNYILNTHKKKR